jgi:methionine synthase I (cobalamin-dependent)/5,10-methylenetetrahydrofolate reductase
MPGSGETHPFREMLKSHVVIFDGAMGTMLYAAGIPYSQCFDALNLSHPDLVRGIHEAYLRAGAEILETNTFGANRIRLGEANETAHLRAINHAGVRLAKEAAAGKALVAGSMGPLGKHLAPIGTLTAAEAESAYREQAFALAEAGADLLVLETMTNLEEMLVAVRAARRTPLPVVALMTFNEEGKTLVGNKPQEVARALCAEGVSAIGANCSVGPQGILEVLERLVPASTVPVVAMPNAGLPSLMGGRYVYLSSPEYIGEFARRAVELGVAAVGGCCGTTPEHIAAMATAVRGLKPRTHAAGQTGAVLREATVPRAAASPAGPAATAPERKPGFYEMLGSRFAISVEIDPPRGLQIERFVASAVYLKGKGADAINVADSPLARPRMSPTAFCHIIQRDAGIETILHVSCRDRNVIATQSELMGAHALGIRNVIAITGDPVQVGGYVGASDVFDLDSVSLTRMISQLNRGQDLTGMAVDEPTQFRVCVAANPTAVDLNVEIEKLRRKIESGAHFIFTQPVYDASDLSRFLDRFGPLLIPLCVGILPLRSARHAEFIHNEVPGMSVPQHIRERMRRAGEHGLEEGTAIAIEILRDARPLCSGAYLMPPFNRFEMAGGILEAFADR